MDVEGARQFQVEGATYDRFMGRYSRLLAPLFADFADVGPGLDVVDVGCGPGALTTELVARTGAERVRAVDPSPSFVAACAARHPGVDVLRGGAEQLPVADATADRVVSQLVLHFVSDAAAAAREFARVLRPGGLAAACVWDFAEGMQLLRLFWDAALAVAPGAPDEARTLRFGEAGEIPALLTAAGFVDVDERELVVTSAYEDLDELWDGLLGGVGPAGAWLVAQDEALRTAVRRELSSRLGDPTGGFELTAVARAGRGRWPGEG